MKTYCYLLHNGALVEYTFDKKPVFNEYGCACLASCTITIGTKKRQCENLMLLTSNVSAAWIQK